MTDFDDRQFHERLAWGMLYTSLPTFLVLRFVVDSPWGKHCPEATKKTFTFLGYHVTMHHSYLGPLLHPTFAWIFFECPNLLWSVYYLIFLDIRSMDVANMILLACFVLHYINRALIYPFRIPAGSKRVPLATASAGFLFTSINGYLQARNLCQFQEFPSNYQFSWQFLLGLTMFVFGMIINIRSDSYLLQLRKGRHKDEYQIPMGLYFEWVSCANHFGETVEWCGFAMACQWSLPSVAFLVYTASNLIPRALSHHAWYHAHFDKYPRHRKAIVPYIL